MKALLRLWLLLMAFGPLAAQAQVQDAGASFACDGKLYQIRQVTSTNSTHLFRVDRTTSPYTTVDLKDLGLSLNALAYNQQDNFLYVLTYSDTQNPRLYKIGANGAKDLGLIKLNTALGSNLPAVKYASGAIDANGVMYFSAENGANIMYRLDISNITTLTPTPVATTVSLRNTGGTATSYTLYDLAINPLNNELYGGNDEGVLYRLVLNALGTQATVTNISSATAVNGGNHPVGTLFFDAAGTLLAASNGTFNGTDDGNFYIVDVTTNPAASTWVKVTTLPRSSQSDGASCVNPPQKIDVVKDLISVTQVTNQVNGVVAYAVKYQIKVKNTATEAGVNATNIQVDDFLFRTATGDNTTNITFPTANLTTASTNTRSRIDSVNIKDDDATVTYTRNTGFTGANGTTGSSSSLLATGQTLKQGKTITIRISALVRFGTVPTATQFNTAIASSSSVTNTGYRLDAATGTLIPPIDLLAADQSTDGATLPSSPNNDVAQPTPLTFGAGIVGNIFEDINYGGGPGRTQTQAGSGGVGVAGVRVELYNNDANKTYRTFTTTDADGFYSFTGLTANNNYVVRVVNGTVKSTRPGGAAATTTVPVQTYANGSKVGGNFPNGVDPGNNTGNLPTTTAQSTLTVQAKVGDPGTADFGFNFDVIVNTNSTGQGSLNQFILNSNALLNDNTDGTTANDLSQEGQTDGLETSIFMIPSASLTNGVAVITPSANLAAITDKYTSIDGTTQTTNIGNNNNGAALGAGGTVGTGATALGTLARPEVQIVGSTARALGLDIASTATGSTITGISIYGFGNATDSDANANIRVAAANTTITGNVIGNSATNFSTAAPVATNADNIRVTAGTGVQITNNLIGFANGNGIELAAAGVTGATISGNEIRSNGGTTSGLDGVSIVGSSATVQNNLLINNTGQGVDSNGSTGSNTISGNTISGNGVGNTETAGVRIYGAGSTVSTNVISNNYGAGVMVASTASNASIRQNSIFGNGTITGVSNAAPTGQIGIDLLSGTDNAAKGSGSFVTLNENGDGDTGGNGLTNMPVIQTALVRNGLIFLTGFSRPGAQLDFYIAAPNAAALNATGSNFGQGQTYLFSRTEGVSGDQDGATGTYSGSINGFGQGTETNQNRFFFAVDVASLTTAQQNALLTGTALLTATATQATAVNGNFGTSEFSGNVPAYLAPVANNDAAITTPGTPVTLTVTANDQNGIDPATVALNGLAPGNTTVTSVTGGSFQFLGSGQVQFTPTAGFIGIATVPYLVYNTSGLVSNTGFITVEVRTPSIDLSTTISAPANNTAINGGAALTYTVVATNGTAAAASTVVETLQLPAGLTTSGTVTITGGQNFASASYNNATGLVTIPVGTLAANSSQNYNVAVSAMPGTGPVTATANISGAVTEVNTANNTAATTVTINPRYDVATTITGSATGVVRGNEITYTVTTSNLSTTAGSATPATNVMQVVTLPTGLTGVFASNGGTYNSVDGKVTFPVISSLAVGQTVVNSISFAAPAANFTVPSATVTAGASSDNAGDLNSPSTGTNNNTAYLNNLASNATVTTTAASASQVNVYTSISSSATNVAPNTAVTLTVTVGNAGPATATSVTETLQLPAGLTGVTVSGGGTYNSTTGVVSFASFGDLASAASTTATVTFNAPGQGFVLATATIMTTAADLLPADNLAQIKVEVAPVANVATTLAGPTTVVPGQVVAYTVTTSNLGEATALAVVQTVSLPAGLTGVTVSGSGTYNSTTGVVTFPTAATLSKGTSQTNSISFSVPAGATNYSAVANVSTTTPETVLTNNAATVVTTVQQTTDLVVSVSGPSSAAAGSAVTYTVTTTNNGPSGATSVVPTLQLPPYLGTVAVPGGSYVNATGLVTFGTVTALVSGNNVINTATFIMPDEGSLNGVARVSAASAESNLDNNFASTATAGSAPSTGTANTTASIYASTTILGPNTQMGIQPTFANAAGSSTATNVMVYMTLPAGLTGVTVSGGTGGSYNSATGLVTWNSAGNLIGGGSLAGYLVVFNTPSQGGTFTASAFLSSSTPETTVADNVATVAVTVVPSADVATGISGPATALPGSTVTYAVTTLNSASSVSAASSTQTVRIPDTATNIAVPAGSSQAAASGGFITITFPLISNQPAGLASEVTNYVSFTAPTAAYTVTATLTPSTFDGDVSSNNTASVSTTLNRVPVAYNVVNALQTPEANTAGSLLLSPLVATDADANTLTYNITSLPASAAGRLYLGTGTSAPVTINQPLTAAQISTLYFDPAAGFIGNAFFTYTATDNFTTPATSNTAIYTLAVGQDVSSVYTAAPAKGGSLATAYQNGDLIAGVLDANGARYSNSGAMYDFAAVNTGTTPNSTGKLVGSDNGVRLATTDAAGTTTLNTLGMTLDPTTGEIRLVDRTKLNLRSGTYTLNVTTVDANGGTNSQVVSFTIGFGPLPVTLVEFTAKAQGDAALLTWKTAQEKDNDHFDVERSIDGLRFEKVGQVAGHGNSTVQQQYSFTDAGASRLAGTVYYRLQQVDTDGTTTASEAKAVSFGKTAGVELTLFPNPASETLNVRLAGAAGTSQVTVYSTTGALVLQGKLAGALGTAFDVRTLPAGTYLVKVLAADGQPRISRFVKY